MKKLHDFLMLHYKPEKVSNRISKFKIGQSYIVTYDCSIPKWGNYTWVYRLFEDERLPAPSLSLDKFLTTIPAKDAMLLMLNKDKFE